MQIPRRGEVWLVDFGLAFDKVFSGLLRWLGHFREE